MESKYLCFGLAIALGLVFPSTAQTTAGITWQLSLDNGTTWQNGEVIAPQSQSSVLVRAQVTIFDNGVPFLDSSRARFAQARAEAYVRSPVPRTDTVEGLVILQPGVPANLFNSTFSLSQHGDLFKIDAFGDTQAPGMFLGHRIDNIVTPVGSTPNRTNPLNILRYQLNLDGTTGDRTFDGGFLAFTSSSSVSAGIDQVLVYPSSGSLTTSAANITQTPATLTIIPTPTTLALFTISSLFATRRRRS
jgi:hypothetical protein